MSDRELATKQERDFQVEWNSDSNTIYREKEAKLKVLRKMRDDISDAVIGYGRALKAMTEHLEEVRKQIADAEERGASRDYVKEFFKKFGRNPYELDFSTPLKINSKRK